MRTAHIDIQFDRTLTTASASLLPTRLAHVHAHTVILPSSLDAHDPVAELVADTLPSGAESSILTPITGGAAHRAFFLPTVLGEWRDAPVPAEGAALDTVLFPTPLLRAAHRIIAVDIVEVARHGPFVLDLAARYTHPRNRVRLVGDRQRPSLAAEVTSALSFDLVVMALILPEGTAFATTTDLIAGELLALALAERCFGTTKSFSGPWEDPVVQRATELHLGALLPANIRLSVSGPSAEDGWAVALRDHVRRRLGLPHLAWPER